MEVRLPLHGAGCEWRERAENPARRQSGARGVYGISYLNPNSAYHLSLGVNYPNAFDRDMAAKDGRKNLGGDIMIHGKNVSSGCLAVGDEPAEELFVLAAEVGTENVKVVIAPTDFRRNGTVSLPKGPDWVPKLYAEIASAMSPYKAPPSAPSLLSLWGLHTRRHFDVPRAVRKVLRPFLVASPPPSGNR